MQLFSKIVQALIKKRKFIIDAIESFCKACDELDLTGYFRIGTAGIGVSLIIEIEAYKRTTSSGVPLFTFFVKV